MKGEGVAGCIEVNASKRLMVPALGISNILYIILTENPPTN